MDLLENFIERAELFLVVAFASVNRPLGCFFAPFSILVLLRGGVVKRVVILNFLFQLGQLVPVEVNHFLVGIVAFAESFAVLVVAGNKLVVLGDTQVKMNELRALHQCVDVTIKRVFGSFLASASVRDQHVRQGLAGLRHHELRSGLMV